MGGRGSARAAVDTGSPGGSPHVPLAYLPGPASGVWHLGPVTVHGYALCVVLGVLAMLWLAERRYRAVGGRRWAIVDLATVAVPAALVGARIYRIAVDYQRYFGPGRDWVGIFRVWDGGLGLPGAAIGGVVAAWLWCRYHDLEIGPVLVAAAPGVAIGRGDQLARQPVRAEPVRTAVDRVLGGADRAGQPDRRLPGFRHVPAAVLVRGDLERGRRRGADQADRAAEPDRRPGPGHLRRRLCGRAARRPSRSC